MRQCQSVTNVFSPDVMLDRPLEAICVCLNPICNMSIDSKCFLLLSPAIRWFPSTLRGWWLQRMGPKTISPFLCCVMLCMTREACRFPFIGFLRTESLFFWGSCDIIHESIRWLAGSLVNANTLKTRIFRAGVESKGRKEAWKFLLGMYPKGSTLAYRQSLLTKRYKEYQHLKAQWTSITDKQAAR